MRIAVASEGLDVAPLFRSTASFMCYTVNRGIITECQNMPNPKLPIDELVALFQELSVNVVITGGIEYEIASRLCHSGIEVVAGASGNVADVVRGYLTKTLSGAEHVCSSTERQFDIGSLHEVHGVA